MEIRRLETMQRYVGALRKLKEAEEALKAAKNTVSQMEKANTWLAEVKKISEDPTHSWVVSSRKSASTGFSGPAPPKRKRSRRKNPQEKKQQRRKESALSVHGNPLSSSSASSKPK